MSTPGLPKQPEPMTRPRGEIAEYLILDGRPANQPAPVTRPSSDL